MEATDIEKAETFFVKYYGWAAFIFLIGMSYFGGIPSDIQQKLFTISLTFLIVPFSLLAIYAITDIGRSVKVQYSKIRKSIEADINDIRNEQKGLKDVKKLIELDNEVLELRQELLGHQDTRFIKFILISIFILLLTLALSMISLEKIIETPTWIGMYITLNYAIYYSFKALFDILTAMRR